MQDKFTTKWKEKIQEHYQNTGKFEHLAFANGFSIMIFALLIMLCIPWALVYSINKQYVVGFDREGRTLFLFVRGLFGGISGTIEEIPLDSMRNLELKDGSIKFQDSEGKDRIVSSVWITRKNFAAITQSMRGL